LPGGTDHPGRYRQGGGKRAHPSFPSKRKGGLPGKTYSGRPVFRGKNRKKGEGDVDSEKRGRRIEAGRSLGVGGKGGKGRSSRGEKKNAGKVSHIGSFGRRRGGEKVATVGRSEVLRGQKKSWKGGGSAVPGDRESRAGDGKYEGKIRGKKGVLPGGGLLVVAGKQSGGEGERGEV